MEFLTPDALVALLTLTLLEIVLGIDNIIFITILTGKLPESQQARARTLGLTLALVMRILLLFSITWVMGLVDPLFALPFGSGEAAELSGRDLILIIGGLFLIGKSTHEIHNRLEGEDAHHGGAKKVPTFTSVLIQIALLDLVFSLDSVITAVGMADELWVMVTAVVVAIGVMMLSMNAVSAFVQKHPTVKMLALAFLLLIGVTLLAEGFDQHISKGYIYSAMAFSVFVEFLNLRAKRNKKTRTVHLNEPYVARAENVAAQS